MMYLLLLLLLLRCLLMMLMLCMVLLLGFLGRIRRSKVVQGHPDAVGLLVVSGQFQEHLPR